MSMWTKEFEAVEECERQNTCYCGGPCRTNEEDGWPGRASDMVRRPSSAEKGTYVVQGLMNG